MKNVYQRIRINIMNMPQYITDMKALKNFHFMKMKAKKTQKQWNIIEIKCVRIG